MSLLDSRVNSYQKGQEADFDEEDPPAIQKKMV